LKHLREIEEDRSLQKYHRLAERADKRDRVILKNEEERQVFEEVFDRRTLMVLYDLANSDSFSYLNGVLSSGKEARVYAGVKSNGSSVAVKIYLVASSDYKRRLQYVVGDPRFIRIRRDSRGIAELWARKEYINLKQCHDVGIPVPEPYDFKGNVVVMEFIGVGDVPAPRLIDCDVNKNDYQRIVSFMVEICQKAKLVHSDLSEYNIMKYNDRLVVFDFSSAISTKHPSAFEFLKRDVANINRFFQKRGIKTLEDDKILKKIGLEDEN
jgi:RIO kinase 1